MLDIAYCLLQWLEFMYKMAAACCFDEEIWQCKMKNPAE
jgi:hypothetical protein